MKWMLPVLQVIFVLAKIAGVIEVSWFFLFLPTVITFVLFITVFLYKLRVNR